MTDSFDCYRLLDVKKVFSSKDRDAAHLALAWILAEGHPSEGSMPLAECREDHNEEEPYQVWSAPKRDPNWQDLRMKDPFPSPKVDITEELLDRLSEKLLERMAKAQTK